MKKIFSIDRIEGEWAVCISDDDDRVDAPVNQLLGMSVRDVFSAELSEGKISDILPLPEERDRRIERNRRRLHDLARKCKK